MLSAHDAIQSWRDTTLALASPRRALPILLVVTALLAAQWWFRPDVLQQVAACAVSLTFLAVVPGAWAALFPSGVVASFRRLVLYGFIACLPAILSLVLREALDGGETLLTDGVNLVVVTALSAVGGWGLARDMQMESGLAAERARSSELEAQAERAELFALRAHLDPHFLFNTLGALAEWTREDPQTAERGILRLADLMRDLMAGVPQHSRPLTGWPLSREINLARSVWELHALRDAERFRHTIDLPDPLPELSVPPLLLLPLVENAVKHGPATGHDGPLSLRVRRDDDASTVLIEIENPGTYGGPRPGSHGLELVERRLAQLEGTHQAPQAFHIESIGDRVRVTLRIPAPEIPASEIRATGERTT